MLSSKSTLKKDAPQMRYIWIPASIDSFPHGASVGVKYKSLSKRQDNCFKVTKKGSYTKVDLPDRILYLIRAIRPASAKTFPPDMDQVLDLDICTNLEHLPNEGFKFAMLNSSALPGKYKAKDYDAEKSSLRILADSGGFQLFSGAADFLDPKDIIESHNLSADIGVALDIPFRQISDLATIKRIARMQRNTLKYFLRHKRPSLDIMNVCHGSTLEFRRMYRDLTEVDECHHLAIAGCMSMTVWPMIAHILSLTEYGRKYQQYHILGVSGVERMLVLAYIAHRSRAPLITSDSSAYIQLGINNKFVLPHQFGTSISVGDAGGIAHLHTTLPCSCPLCGIVKYLRVFTLKDESVHHLATYHNLLAYHTLSEVLNDLAKLPHKEILNWVKFNTSDGVRASERLATAFTLADTIFDGGIKAALKKFPSVATHQNVKPAGLFSSPSDTETKNVRKKILGILDRYEAYFANLK